MSQAASTGHGAEIPPPLAGANHDPGTAPPAPAEATLNDTWLHDFYKECGREITLAYTTLNQMKNWAIAVQAAIITAVASFGRSPLSPGDAAAGAHLGFAVVAGAALAYLFTLRFFVRAILCYINLLRWNTLQSAILEYGLCPRESPSTPPVEKEQLERNLRRHIQDYYFSWLARVPRRAQIASNLKLGFGLLIALPLLLLLWGATVQWHDSFVRGLVTFAIGGTLIEVMDFLASHWFDTPAVAAKRGAERYIFPAPSGDLRYVAVWLLNVTISGIVALWPWIRPTLCFALCQG